MNSYERTMAAVSHSEADRVPLFLLLSYYGAKELQIPITGFITPPPTQPENAVVGRKARGFPRCGRTRSSRRAQTLFCRVCR